MSRHKLVLTAALVIAFTLITFAYPLTARCLLAPNDDALVTHVPVTYAGFAHGLIYYGPLRRWVGLGKLNLSFLVVDGGEVNTPKGRLVAQELLRNGVQVYAYLSKNGKPLGLGSSFNNLVVSRASTGRELGTLVSEWVDQVKSVIASYYGEVTGVFFDECDPSYFGVEDPSNPYVKAFNNALRELIDYAHSLGLKVFVNGVRAYASYGDLYLWEGFCSDFTGLNNGSVTYTYVTDFFGTHESDANPYSWVNDYSKYEYLRSHGLLNRTVALSYGPPHDYGRMRVCYYVARILGLRGFAYGPWDNYAGDPDVSTLFIYPLGAPLGPPHINSSSGLVTREFMDGAVSVNVTSASVMLEDLTYALPHHVVPDGSLSEWGGRMLKVSHAATTPSNDIVEVGACSDDANLYVALRFREPHSNPFGIFLDLGIKGGYRFMGIGADLYVEAYPSTNEAVGYYYLGNGSEWLWSREVFVTRLGSGSNLSFEVVIPRYALKGARVIKLYLVSYDSNFNTVDIEPYGAPLTVHVRDSVHSLYYLTKYFMVNHSSPLSVVALCSNSTYAGFPAWRIKVEGIGGKALTLRLRRGPSLIILSSPHVAVCAYVVCYEAKLTYRGGLQVSVEGGSVKEYRIFIPHVRGLLSVYLVVGPSPQCVWVVRGPHYLLPT